MNDLPNHELLEALAHVFAVLSSIVAEAHTQAGGAFSPVCCPNFASEDLKPNLIPPCMISGQEKRRVRIKLESREFVAPRERRTVIRRNDRKLRGIQERYGVVVKPMPAPRDLLTMGRQIHDLAKVVLAKDGYHVHVVHLTRGDQLVGLKQIEVADQAEKHLVWHTVAEEIKRADVDGVIATGEAWRAQFDPANPSRRASESPGREEILQTCIASKAGLRIAIITPFTRNASDQIELGRTHESEMGLVFMEPVFEAWRRREH